MTRRLNPDHIAQILQALADNQQPILKQQIRKETPKIETHERDALIELLNANGFIELGGAKTKKRYPRYRNKQIPPTDLQYLYGITDKGSQYLAAYNNLQDLVANIKPMDDMVQELDWVILVDSIRPPPKKRKKVSESGRQRI